MDNNSLKCPKCSSKLIKRILKSGDLQSQFCWFCNSCGTGWMIIELYQRDDLIK